MSGVFAVARDIWDHPVFRKDESFSEREAWIWLIGAAAWKQYRVGRRGLRDLTLERGEFCFSQRFLAEKFGWSKTRVRCFLEMLEKQTMIRCSVRVGADVYMLLNYNEYQVIGLPDRAAEKTASETATRPRQDRDATKDETFKHSNIKEESISAEMASPPLPGLTDSIPQKSPKQRQLLNGHAIDFEAFYEAYANKKARLAAEKAYVAALKRGATSEQLLNAARKYATGRKGEDPRFTKHPATWLNEGCWMDEPSGKPRAGPDPEFLRIQAENDRVSKMRQQQ